MKAGNTGFVGYGQELGLYLEKNVKQLRVLDGGREDEICILGSTSWLLEENRF